nr:hypothetical protein [Bradyrhizobium sp. LTSPM299]
MTGQGKRRVSLLDRLVAFARINREAAEKLPPGAERDALLEKARKADETVEIERSGKGRRN